MQLREKDCLLCQALILSQLFNAKCEPITIILYISAIIIKTKRLYLFILVRYWNFLQIKNLAFHLEFRWISIILAHHHPQILAYRYLQYIQIATGLRFLFSSSKQSIKYTAGSSFYSAERSFLVETSPFKSLSLL